MKVEYPTETAQRIGGNKMTVFEYLTNRPEGTYGKKIHVLDKISHKNLGKWLDNRDKEVYDIKVTSKILFIFV